MKATALVQMDAAKPGLFDGKALAAYVLHILGIDQPEKLFAPPQPPQQPPGPDPLGVAALQMKEKELAIKREIEMARLKDRAADRVSKEKFQTLEIAQRLATHPESEGVVKRVLGRK